MQLTHDQGRRRIRSGVTGFRYLGRPSLGQMAAWLVAAAVLVFALKTVSQINPDKSTHEASLTKPPDANAQMEMQDQGAKQQNIKPANAERKRQVADDSAKLLKLATELKTEVDKTDKDTLSLTVIRKADAIEKLAHNVKEKMKPTVGVN